jgi:hypothetical protein
MINGGLPVCVSSGLGMIEALRLPLLPGFDAVITQYRDVIDRY